MTATLIGPDRVPRQLLTGPREPGTYNFTWTGRTPDNGPEPEGQWRWVVNALDEQGQESKSERVFYLNNTLGYLRVKSSRGGSLRVAFRLAHPARVTLTIETKSGARVRTIRKSLRPGQTSISWNGRYANGVRAFSGPYVARVHASNSLGPSDLESPFVVRR